MLNSRDSTVLPLVESVVMVTHQPKRASGLRWEDEDSTKITDSLDSLTQLNKQSSPELSPTRDEKDTDAGPANPHLQE